MTYLKIARMQSVQTGVNPYLKIARMQSIQNGLVATVDAGPDQVNVEPGDIVSLHATVTGLPSDFSAIWTQSAGLEYKIITINNANTADANFTAPALPDPGGMSGEDGIPLKFQVHITHPDMPPSQTDLFDEILIRVRPHTVFVKLGGVITSALIRITVP